MPKPAEEEIKIIDGKKYKKVPSGYSVRKFYSHEGPGWDYRFKVLEKYGVDEPEDLPDEPHYNWELIEN